MRDNFETNSCDHNGKPNLFECADRCIAKVNNFVLFTRFIVILQDAKHKYYTFITGITYYQLHRLITAENSPTTIKTVRN